MLLFIDGDRIINLLAGLSFFKEFKSQSNETDDAAYVFFAYLIT